MAKAPLVGNSIGRDGFLETEPKRKTGRICRSSQSFVFSGASVFMFTLLWFGVAVPF
jgi:hypothetical protein